MDPRYLRPSEVDLLQGDASKARRLLQWRPRASFRQLARMMTDADMQLAERECFIREHARIKAGMTRDTRAGAA
jgi:GDPmannose 4,6-dehydratase